jgi:hypothetical protein
MKSLPMLEKKKKIPSSDSDEEEENEFFIIEIQKICTLLDDYAFDQQSKCYSCNTMNYWCRKAIQYPIEENAFISTDAMKILEKVEPNKEKSEEIYIIFNRVWHHVMSQCLKYLKEENME